MNWGVVGALLLAAGVASGAFGAHALRGRLDDYLMGIWEKAVFYHFVHALGMIIVAVMVRIGLCSSPGGARACTALLVGVLLFSGSLYLLALTGNRSLGAVTPLGGVAFIAGWLLLAVDLARNT